MTTAAGLRTICELAIAERGATATVTLVKRDGRIRLCGRIGGPRGEVLSASRDGHLIARYRAAAILRFLDREGL